MNYNKNINTNTYNIILNIFNGIINKNLSLNNAKLYYYISRINFQVTYCVTLLLLIFITQLSLIFYRLTAFVPLP